MRNLTALVSAFDTLAERLTFFALTGLASECTSALVRLRERPRFGGLGGEFIKISLLKAVVFITH